MKYKVALQHSDEGYSVSVPGLPGCWSQGKTEAEAIANVREICDSHLIGRHRLSIVDLNQEPNQASEHHVLATPTLIKDLPLPSRMLVGDMSDHVRILLALDITASDTVAPIAVDG